MRAANALARLRTCAGLHELWQLEDESRAPFDLCYCKSCVKRPLSKRLKISLFLTTNYRLLTDTTLELSVFWPSDKESRINELRFSESISLSFKTRLTSVTCFCSDVT